MGTANPTLLEQIPTLTQQQQDLVQAFIKQIKEEEAPHTVTFEEAYQKFVSRHRKLLELLAQ